MAERVEKLTPASSVADSATEDLSVLFPDISIELQNKQVIVREYKFMQWLRLKPQCADFIEDLVDVLKCETDVQVDDILELFESNFDLVKTMVIASTQCTLEFLELLGDDDMQSLLWTWWNVNKHFFLRSANRLLRPVATK